VYAASNRPQGMIQAYEAARSKFPEYLPTYILLAQVYEYVGNVDQARQTYQDALKVDPNSYQAMSNLARLYGDHGGSLSEALELAQKAKTEQPDDPGVNDTLGWIYYKQGLYRSAVPVLEAAVAKNPQAAKFQYPSMRTRVCKRLCKRALPEKTRDRRKKRCRKLVRSPIVTAAASARSIRLVA
jgi:tetratricopeptide (TPR) repeat protein